MSDGDEHELPARPLAPEVEASITGSCLTLTYQPSSNKLLGVVASLMFFGYALISSVIFAVEHETIEWGIAQIVGVLAWGTFGFCFVGLMLFGFVGMETIALGPHGLEYEFFVLIRFRRVIATLPEVLGIHAKVTESQDCDLPNDILSVEFELTGSRQVSFASGIDKKEQEWLVAMIAKHLAMLRAQADLS